MVEQSLQTGMMVKLIPRWANQYNIHEPLRLEGESFGFRGYFFIRNRMLLVGPQDVEPVDGPW